MYVNTEFVEKVDLVCQRIAELFHTPIIFLDEYNNKFNEQYASNILHPYAYDKVTYLTELFKDNEYSTIPVIEPTKEGFYYFSINLIFNDVYYGRFIVGPATDKRYTRKEIQEMYDALGNTYDLDFLVEYYHHVNKLNLETISTYAWLCRTIVNQICDIGILRNKNKLETHENDLQQVRNIEIMQQKIYRHSGYNADKIMIESVKNGYPEEIKKYLKEYWLYTGRKELLTGTLRDRKNFAISFIATIIQASIYGGLDYEYASRLNLKYISIIESKTKITELAEVEEGALYTLSNKVKELKRQGYTKLVRDCRDYIKENISLDLKVYEIAEYFHLDVKYISKRFKKETEETIKNYINRKKVEEAKRMMQSSDMPLTEVSAYLSFNDQSHFTKVFKTHAGVTPSAYQKQIKSI